MQREQIITKDGSTTIAIPAMGATYHSIHGALQESQHVYIQAGLETVLKKVKAAAPIRVFEMGLGTGLNALLTGTTANKEATPVFYECVEILPLPIEEIKQLNYCSLLNEPGIQQFFELLHSCDWGKTVAISNYFEIQKHHCTLRQWQPSCLYNLVYFDAFAPSAQPEIWTKEIFEKLYKNMATGGILVTYCSKGEVRRNLTAAGFVVKKLPGPPGKREILSAEKL
jgi:tRNA U34 5-methylaminomethyl-2-thiouridine-forming methyltransferase MnmC